MLIDVIFFCVLLFDVVGVIFYSIKLINALTILNLNGVLMCLLQVFVVGIVYLFICNRRNNIKIKKGELIDQNLFNKTLNKIVKGLIYSCLIFAIFLGFLYFKIK